jgi:hypothetical protein
MTIEHRTAEGRHRVNQTTAPGVKEDARAVFFLASRDNRRYLEDAAALPHYGSPGRREQIVESEFADVCVVEMMTDAFDVIGDEVARNVATILLTHPASTLCPLEIELASSCNLHEPALLIAHKVSTPPLEWQSNLHCAPVAYRFFFQGGDD